MKRSKKHSGSLVTDTQSTEVNSEQGTSAVICYTFNINSSRSADKKYIRIIDKNNDVTLDMTLTSTQIRLNSKYQGKWGRELARDVPLDMVGDSSMYLYVSEKEAIFCIENILYATYTLPNTSVPVARVATSFSDLRVSQAVLEDSHFDSYLRMPAVKVFGQWLRLPKFSPSDAPEIKKAIDLICQMHARDFSPLAAQSLSYIVMEWTFHPIEVIMACLLFTRPRFIVPVSDATAQSNISALAELNGLDRVDTIMLSGPDEHGPLGESHPRLSASGGILYVIKDAATICALDRYIHVPPGNCQQTFISNLRETASTAELKALMLRPNSCGSVTIANSRLKATWGYASVSDRPHVDVIVAMYNTEAYIEDTVRSLELTDTDLCSVIVVDDGSSDKSNEIVSDLALSRPWLSVVRKMNGGCASARNYGRMLSSASHIAFMDADDFTDPCFYSNLLLAAVVSGCELVQASFDFFDADRAVANYDSYEEKAFKQKNRFSVLGLQCFQVAGTELILGQPSIWRRVHRRDFLDSRNVWFPESVRAFDDYYFQLLTLHYARDIIVCEGAKYHYRQHAGQDIKQGDERHFYELYMMESILQRSIEEGWEDISPYLRSFANTTAWTIGRLRGDLVGRYLEGLADVIFAWERTFGRRVVDENFLSVCQSQDFHFFYEQLRRDSEQLPDGYHWGLVRNRYCRPEYVNLIRKLS